MLCGIVEVQTHADVTLADGSADSVIQQDLFYMLGGGVLRGVDEQ